MQASMIAGMLNLTRLILASTLARDLTRPAADVLARLCAIFHTIAHSSHECHKTVFFAHDCRLQSAFAFLFIIWMHTFRIPPPAALRCYFSNLQVFPTYALYVEADTFPPLPVQLTWMSLPSG